MPNRSSPSSYPNRVWIWPAGDNAGYSTRTTRGVEVITRRANPADLRVDFDEAQLCNDDDDEDMLDYGSEADRSNLEDVRREPIPPCSALQCGQRYKGRQRMERLSEAVPSADWRVEVLIHTLDMEKGNCTGIMSAYIPQSTTPILTQFEGEIIDDINNSFVTCKWGTSYQIDMTHWKKFPGFRPLAKTVQAKNGRCNYLSQHDVIFMRWKETHFLNANEDSGLTIAGFYYIAFCRKTGKISGYYFDPVSKPFQRLELEAGPPHSLNRKFNFCTAQDIDFEL